MPSSWSPSLRFELQFTGENINLWGEKLNAALAHADYAVAGWLTKPLTGNATLTTANAGDDEARAAMIKFTGGAGPFTVTIPSVSKAYLVWNACAGPVTLTTGAGATVTVDGGDIAFVACDGSGVRTPGYAGLSIKDYVAAAALEATGSLPAALGHDGKALIVNAGSWVPTPWAASSAQVLGATAPLVALTPASVQAARAPVALADGATITLDLDLGANFTVTLAGNRTLATPSHLQPGKSGILTVRQDATGSRTLSYGSGWKFPGGPPALSTAANAADTIAYYIEDAAMPVIRAVVAKAYA